MTDTTDQQVEESHRFFIRAARDFYDSGRDNFTPNYDNYGDLLASAEAIASLASVSSASAEIPAGMKPWAGGDAAPADWDGGPVYLDWGNREFETYTDEPQYLAWKHDPVAGKNQANIIAYTPKVFLPADVRALVIAAREFWDDENSGTVRSHALDKALEAFSSRVPYDDEPTPEPVPATNQAGGVERLAKIFADASDYYIPFHRGLSSPSADKIRKGMTAVVAALATQPATSQEAIEAGKVVLEGRGDGTYAEAEQAIRSLIAHIEKPATSQEGEDEDAIHDCGNLGWCQAPGCCSRHGTAPTKTPPTLSEDLRGVLEFYADRDGDGYQVDVTNYGLSTEEGEIVRDRGERARSALAQVKAS